MENQKNVARARVLLDTLGERMQRLNTLLHAVMDDIARDMLPPSAALEALRADLNALAQERAELGALDAAMGGIFPSNSVRADCLAALAEYEAATGRKQLLGTLDRMRSDDAECMSAIAAVQERYRFFSEQTDVEAGTQFSALKLLVEAFRQEKPILPMRQFVSYNTKLAADFPEVLISAVLVNDPPIYLAEAQKAASSEARGSDAEEAVDACAGSSDAADPACAEEPPATAAEDAPSVPAGQEQESEEECVVTSVFDRVRNLCAERHPLVEMEDHSSVSPISTKGIKRYVMKGEKVIGIIRTVVLHLAQDNLFTAACAAHLSNAEMPLVQSVLADMVQRGYLCAHQFAGLPQLYIGVPALKKTCAASKELVKHLCLGEKSGVEMASEYSIAPHEALAAILCEKAFFHGARRKAVKPNIAGGVRHGCGIVRCSAPHLNEMMVFLTDVPDGMWMKAFWKRYRADADTPHMEILAYDAAHLDETRAFLSKQLGHPFAEDEYYLFADDTWAVCTHAEDSAEEESASDAGVMGASSGMHAPASEEETSVTAAPLASIEEQENPKPAPVSASAQPEIPEEPPVREKARTAHRVHNGTDTQTAWSEPAPAPMDRAKMTAELHAMLEAEDYGGASAYVHAAAYFDPSWAGMNRALSYALYAPLQKCRYSSDSLMNIYFTEADEESCEGLAVAAILWNFYLDHISYDYAMQSLMDMARSFPLLKDVTALSDVLYALMRFKQQNESGVDKYADYRLKDKSRIEAKMAQLEVRAKEFEDKYINGHITENGSNRRFIETQKLIFDHGDYLAQSLRAIVEGDVEAFDVVRAYVSDTFLDTEGGGDSLDVQNISAAKIEKLIDARWYEAGSLVAVKKQSSKLVGSFRSTLQNRLEKIAVLLVEWLDCVDALGIRDTDEALAAYSKLRPTLLDQLRRSAEGLDAANLPAWQSSVLRRTLTELTRRINGAYDEKEHRYFYADFLRTPYVLLDADFLPRVTRGVAELEEFFPPHRIEQHFHAEKISLTDRLREILDGSDDLGSARQIVHLLEDMGRELDPSLRAAVERLDEALIEPRAKQRKIDFIESLELAQSYGQIESSAEDKKEKILQSINVVYDLCLPSLDFGFFETVVTAFREKIAREAMKRGAILAKELAELRRDAPIIMDAEEEERRAKKFARIDEMIAAKNYTAAEDMLHRFGTDDEDSPLESLRTDELRDFLRSYDVCYSKVYDAGQTVRSLLRFKGSTKASRGGDKLVEAWLPRSGSMDVQRVRLLLQQLGFSISEVRVLPRTAKTEQYEVLLAEPAGGRRSFSHPFADFGSKGARAPFRVLCLYGKFDADALIAKFKEVGTAKHTLVLLDYALPKDQRNRLARKTKSDIPECAFAVIDRVAVAYLAENYAETKLLHMLFSITMPYTYYQPYIPNAANPMPPEMFIGRKEALDKIMDPLGENIIYGGRQLGKSALLRMAEHSVNRLGDGSCALMVDIKSCDAEEAALRISRACADRKILARDFETRDWGELARAIQLRLMGEEEQIPYFLLLIDEADAFIESCKVVDYRPFEEMKRIQSAGEERFKFVIAGLRNVVRFDKETLGNNSVLAHLKSYTVRPFSVMEARELLEMPLSFLGLRFPEEKQALVSTILATTNYFPGLIQLYCYKLIEAMKKDYAGYNEAGSPPYDISETHIKKVLNENDFLRDIYTKFDITLRVDEDCYYHIIATLMAYLYHEHNDQRGYLPGTVLALGQELGIVKMQTLSIENVHALMEELRELNVLRQTANGRYLFTRYNFFQMMGSRDKLTEDLLMYMEESDGTHMVG